MLRHGQSEWNALGRWQGQADIELTDLGYEQARRAAQKLGMFDAARVLGAAVRHVHERDGAALEILRLTEMAVVYRAFTWDRLRESVYLTARTSAMVCFLFVGSATFASVFGYLGGEHLVKDFMLALDLSPLQFLLLSQFLIFILGWPLEWSEIIIIFVPIFLPLLPLYGIDPILFGILIAVNLQTAFLTPPMAMSAYYLKGVAPKSLQLNTIFSGCMPFVYIILFTLAMTYVFPAMVSYLPDQFFNQAVEMERDPNDESVVNPDFFKQQ